MEIKSENPTKKRSSNIDDKIDENDFVLPTSKTAATECFSDTGSESSTEISLSTNSDILSGMDSTWSTDDDICTFNRLKCSRSSLLKSLAEALVVYDDTTDEVQHMVLNQASLVFQCQLCRCTLKSLRLFINHKEDGCQAPVENETSHSNACQSSQSNTDEDSQSEASTEEKVAESEDSTMQDLKINPDNFEFSNPKAGTCPSRKKGFAAVMQRFREDVTRQELANEAALQAHLASLYMMSSRSLPLYKPFHYPKPIRIQERKKYWKNPRYYSGKKEAMEIRDVESECNKSLGCIRILIRKTYHKCVQQSRGCVTKTSEVEEANNKIRSGGM